MTKITSLQINGGNLSVTLTKKGSGVYIDQSKTVLPIDDLEECQKLVTLMVDIINAFEKYLYV